jgi:hypothetical protein
MSKSIDKTVDGMRECATTKPEAGQPLIPDGPYASTAEVYEFRVLAGEMGVATVVLGQKKDVTQWFGEKSPDNYVHLTPWISVGTLTDEFLHVWNNHAKNRGRYINDLSLANEHITLNLCRTPPSEIRYHQLELLNYTEFVSRMKPQIPGFVWRAFNFADRK